MKEIYIDYMEKIVKFYSLEHIKKYYEKNLENGLSEHGFTRLTSNIGILISHGKRPDLKEIFVQMMNLCCKEIPTARKRNGNTVGNDFSVKEIVLCIMELEKYNIFPKSLTDGWRKLLSSIDPYKTYSVIAENPPKPVNNWAAFGAASEQMRKFAHIGDESAFIDNQIESQLFSFDENGMYRDPDEPIVYDFVARLQLMVALFFGYDGKFKDKLENLFLKSADLTFKSQSVTGEILYGGRSNQFLHNESLYIAICEFYASLFYKHHDNVMACKFKRAAKISLNSLSSWLHENPVSHIKNHYPKDSKYGCEDYAYYDKYMVTTASWLFLAHSFANDEISELPCPCESGNYILTYSDYFHKYIINGYNYFIEYDYNADFHYDCNGLGRVHKRNIHPITCISVPCTESPNYLTDIKNKGNLSICGGIKTEKGYYYSSNQDVTHKLISKNEENLQLTFECTFKNGEKLLEIVKITKEGVLFTCEHNGIISIIFPVLMFDGSNKTIISKEPNKVKVNYLDNTCIYESKNEISDTNEVYANRNGHYKAMEIHGEKKLSILISLK